MTRLRAKVAIWALRVARRVSASASSSKSPDVAPAHLAERVDHVTHDGSSAHARPIPGRWDP